MAEKRQAAARAAMEAGVRLDDDGAGSQERAARERPTRKSYREDGIKPLGGGLGGLFGRGESEEKARLRAKRAQEVRQIDEAAERRRHAKGDFTPPDVADEQERLRRGKDGGG